jgi:hypothetical protein
MSADGVYFGAAAAYEPASFNPIKQERGMTYRPDQHRQRGPVPALQLSLQG